MKFTTHSPEETEALGQRLGAQVSGGVVALFGGLGAGKTAFVRGFARGAGYSGRVTSPTFAIVNEYRGGRLAVFHFDLYRLASSDELYDIGWEDYLAEKGVCVTEWSENIEDAIPAEAVRVTIEPRSDSVREITVEGIAV